MRAATLEGKAFAQAYAAYLVIMLIKNTQIVQLLGVINFRLQTSQASGH